MRTYSQFLEDLEQRKAELARRKQDQMARLKQQSAQTVSDAGERLAAAKEKGAADQEAIDAKKQEDKDKRDAATAASLSLSAAILCPASDTL